MALDAITTTDAALLLEALAQILREDLPPLQGVEADERTTVANACVDAARQVVGAREGDVEDHSAAAAYAGGEWHRALLRALLGYEGAELSLARTE